MMHRGLAALPFGYLIVAVAGLIVLRASFDRLNFIGIGWLMVLAIIPLLPWALPRLPSYVKTMSPYIKRVGVGPVRIDLRAVTDQPILASTIIGESVLAGLENNPDVLSNSTGIATVLANLRSRIPGGVPCAIVDLQTGHKWRLPNLYFLSVVLEIDPVVGILIFTEMRKKIDGYFVRMSRPGEFRRQIDDALPAYRVARSMMQSQLPANADLSNQNTAMQLTTAFSQFVERLREYSGEDADQVVGWVGAKRLDELVVSPRSPVVESPGVSLSSEQLRIVVTAADRYVPATTAAGRLSGLIDRDKVALAIGRAAMAGTPAT